MSDFPTALTAFLDELFELHPTFATNVGDHRFDARWPDMTDAGRRARLDFGERWIATLTAMHDLTGDDAIDRDQLVMELEEARFTDTDLRDDATDSLSWIYVLGDGLLVLITREFAPLIVRLGSVAGRLEGIPAVLDAAREVLVGTPARPVGRFQTETALERLPGITALIDDALAAAAEGAADADVAAIIPRLEAGAAVAREAITAFASHLRDMVLPRSEGDGRLGPELFAAKMRHTMRSADLTPERILAEAERQYPVVRAELVRLARDAWPTWCPDQEPPADDGAMVRAVLDAIAVDHPKADELIDFCHEEITRIEAFCVERDLIGMVSEPLDIRWTPVFLRSFGGAMLSTPGPLDKGEKAFFSITPVPDDWTDEQRESYLREDNARMLRLMAIHEAVPGHYLQGVFANRCPSLVRSIFWSGPFAEGWAVYVTQVMMDVGYGADDPALLLTHWKFYLRSITNAIIDVRIHTAGMTETEAVDLMVDGGFQEEAEARAKYSRARLSSTQLSTYFTGSMEMWAIELEARRRAAGAAGAAIDPPSDLPGGFAATPGFRYRDHLESVIGHGSPPPSILRRILFD